MLTTIQTSYTQPTQCHKFQKCNAPICPLDSDWQKRVMLNEDAVCFYLTESVKEGARAVFERAGLGELFHILVQMRSPISTSYPRIRRGLERSVLTGSRMSRFASNGDGNG